MTGDQQAGSLVYDAWNRLVSYQIMGVGLESYQYDALNRRVVENPGVQRVLYYSSSWQVLEEDVAGTMQDQYVWSPVYVDAMIERDRPTERLYVQQDANWNVTAAISTAGSVQERYIYDPYGAPTVLDPSWNTRASSLFAWVYLHQGGRYDSLSGLYLFRHREYSAILGRWLQLDPVSYGGGDDNLYDYIQNSPASATDPSGYGPINVTNITGPTPMFEVINGDLSNPGGWWAGSGTWGQPANSASGTYSITSKSATTTVTVKGVPGAGGSCNTVQTWRAGHTSSGQINAWVLLPPKKLYTVEIRISMQLSATAGANIGGNAVIRDYWGKVVMQGNANGQKTSFKDSKILKYTIKQANLAAPAPLLHYEPTLSGQGGTKGEATATGTIEVLSVTPN
jgi:RHS repeat-associated protein